MDPEAARSPPSDENLLERARGGDQAALRTLFDRHQRALEARIRRFLPPAVQRRVAISDVLQETRILAFERTVGFESLGKGAYKAWLLRIAELKAREALRHHAGTAKRAVGREASRGRRSAPPEAVGRSPSPGERAADAELRDSVLRALGTLPTDHGEVLRLTLLRGLTLDEAAGCMGRSREAVKKLYGRAMGSLATAMGLSRGRGT